MSQIYMVEAMLDSAGTAGAPNGSVIRPEPCTRVVDYQLNTIGMSLALASNSFLVTSHTDMLNTYTCTSTTRIRY
jgi:hypothetical protein